MNNIEWEAFESQYMTLEQGEGRNFKLANWRQVNKSFDDGKPPKPHIEFDVLSDEKKTYNVGEKLFSTGAMSFAAAIRPLIENRESRGFQSIEVYVEYGKDKKYRVVDLEKVRGIIAESDKKKNE